MPAEAKEAFEIPAEMRALTENTVEQARTAFDGFITAAHKAVNDIEEHAQAAQTSAKTLRRKALDFAEANVEAAFDFAQRLVRAKNAEEVVRLQTEFLQSQMQNLGEQARDLGETAMKPVTGAS